MKNDMSLSDRLQACYSGAVYDVLKSKGFTNQVLPNTVRPLQIDLKTAGRVFTIEGRVNESLTAHESLLMWCELLSEIPADHVAICQPNDKSIALMGELSAETLKFKNVRGFIVEGGCRDSAFIEKLGFPVFCEFFTPADVVAKWSAVSYEKPIKIGSVEIQTGDYVMADRDGVVIIPENIIEEVIEETETVLKTENLVRKAILEGIDPVEAYLRYGKF